MRYVPHGAVQSAAARSNMPDQPPTHDELTRRALKLVPALKDRAAMAEELRRLPEDTISDLHASRLFRMLQPRRVGGSELPYRALVELTAIIGRGCGSTAWVLSNLATHHWMLAMWPPAAQDEVWGGSPDALIGSAFVFPAGHALRTKGGYRLNGRWKFSSGIDPCAWNMLGAVVTEEETGLSEYRLFLLPRSDYHAIDTWFAAGLKGTDSKDVEVKDAFVPEHRTLAVDRTKGGATPGAVLNPAPLYRLPVFDLFPYVVAAAVLGIAQGAVADFITETAPRITSYGATRMADYATIQAKLAEAAALVDAAELTMLRTCDQAMAVAEANEVPGLEQKVRWRRDGAFAARMCRRAVDLLFEAGGGEALFNQRPLQRAFRDVHAASGHNALVWDIAAATYGKVMLGLAPDNPTI
jgi:3-hydroxy-9,10-secoandrosta-1,3,5(10)-triene-9,17-dione monooxygenase